MEFIFDREESTNKKVKAIIGRKSPTPKRIKRVLELNPEHAMVKTLAKLNNDGASGLEPFARLLLDHAEIAEGRVEDPAGFAGRLQALMAKAAQSLDAG